MKKFLFIVLLMSFIILLSNLVFASENIQAILNKEYTIVFNGEQKEFYNAKGEVVYPILYDGTNYLPIRNWI